VVDQDNKQQTQYSQLTGSFPHYTVLPAPKYLQKKETPQNVTQPILFVLTAVAFLVIGIFGYKYYVDNDLGNSLGDISKTTDGKYNIGSSNYEYTHQYFPDLIIPYNETWDLSTNEENISISADLESFYDQYNIRKTVATFKKDDTTLKFILLPTTFIEGIPTCYKTTKYPYVHEIDQNLIRISYDSGGVIDDFVYSFNFKLKNSKYSGNKYQFNNYFDSYKSFGSLKLNPANYNICGYGSDRLRTEEVTTSSYPSYEYSDATLVATIDIELEGTDEDILNEADIIVNNMSY